MKPETKGPWKKTIRAERRGEKHPRDRRPDAQVIVLSTHRNRKRGLIAIG